MIVCVLQRIVCEGVCIKIAELGPELGHSHCHGNAHSTPPRVMYMAYSCATVMPCMTAACQQH